MKRAISTLTPSRVFSILVPFLALALHGRGDTFQVTFSNFSFTPNRLTIHVGDTVTWSNSGGSHTVTGDGVDPFCGTGFVLTTCSHTFTTAGTFPYHCVPHAAFGMTGSITVLPAANKAPTLTLVSPGNGSVFLPPGTVVATANAGDTDGTVAKVEFSLNGNLVSTSTQSPYTATVNGLAPGVYTLGAQATDNLGATSAVATATFTVARLGYYRQRNLVSDLPGMAATTDPKLVNPWALATTAAGPFWVTDNHTGLSTVYGTAGDIQPVVVTVPPAPAGDPTGNPTGMVFNNTPAFLLGNGKPALFIFASEDGTVTAWNTGGTAELKVNNHPAGAIYKGLALAATDAGPRLYAADFHNGKVDVFDGTFAPITPAGGFLDPALPAGYAPFGIQSLQGQIVVTYAVQDADREDDIQGPGNGFVDVFDTAGSLVRRFAGGGSLNSPWGLAIAPDGFGPASGQLLVGNFGDGAVNTFRWSDGAWTGLLSDESGRPLSNPGLWGLKFGNGGKGGETAKLYFAAGIPGSGSLEDHGLLGVIEPVAPLQIWDFNPTPDGHYHLAWVGGKGPYTVQQKSALDDATWNEVLTTPTLEASVPAGASVGFLRILDNAP
jgi:uncharacterized protein (TIGR03118 family)